MFERFTKDAREVVTGAVALAATLGQSHVGPEHLAATLPTAGGRVADLLAAHHVDPAALTAAAGGGTHGGILSDAEVEVLRSVGVDADEVLRRIEQEFGAQEPTRPSRRRLRRPLRPEVKVVLTQSLRQAQAMHHRELRTEHILLALLAQPAPDPATRLIQSRGLTYDTARSTLVA
ncbi:Clp protease N-terminal domain-containing protein [Rhizomonospora bruguierae]|uniref:Clp protease N-terminal domain-containing protein n=1 Tax=Rhizomonospora bruguierae TaxID=1581705 RepID=UPI001BCB102F|nr:Clp protease N-terminal domain-containing protein [Micromonospora sp. NBRC 107566]